MRDVPERVQADADALDLLARASVEPGSAFAVLVATAGPDARARTTARAVVSLIAPSRVVLRALALDLAVDRHGTTETARMLLRRAGAATLTTAAALLDERDSLVQRGTLQVMHATELPLDAHVARIRRLVAPGVDAFVRRSAARCLGHCVANDHIAIEALAALRNEWDPSLRLTAAVAIGQRARGERADGRYAQTLATVRDDDIAELASVLRRAGAWPPPEGPLLDLLARTHGFARLDLADAMLDVVRQSARPVPDLGAALAGRLDDAIEALAPRDRTRMASMFMEHADDADAVVRAASLVFAHALDAGVGAAIVLQRHADADASEAVRRLARSLLEEQ